MHNDPISAWPESEQPRERLSKHGASALSDAELFSIFFRKGSDDGANELDLARRLLTHFRSLQALTRCDAREIAEVPGIGLDQALEITAMVAISRRIAREVPAKLKMDSPEIVCQVLGQHMRAHHREVLWVLLLDTKYHLMRIEEVSMGSINESVAHPREIFRPALIHSAYAVILSHNHPSGNPEPSKSDRLLTRQLVEVGELLKIPVLDHVIVGGRDAGEPSFFSFMGEGVL